MLAPGDKMQILDFGESGPGFRFIGSIENFFVKEVFWSIAKKPYQAQKTIFMKFEQWGMGLGMFWWSNRLKLGNLSLIYEIMRICEKKLDTFRIGNCPTATTLSRFWPEKAVSSTGT